jgi:hypothetical protein
MTTRHLYVICTTNSRLLHESLRLACDWPTDTGNAANRSRVSSVSIPCVVTRLNEKRLQADVTNHGHLSITTLGACVGKGGVRRPRPSSTRALGQAPHWASPPMRRGPHRRSHRMGGGPPCLPSTPQAGSARWASLSPPPPPPSPGGAIRCMRVYPPSPVWVTWSKPRPRPSGMAPLSASDTHPCHPGLRLPFHTWKDFASHSCSPLLPLVHA